MLFRSAPPTAQCGIFLLRQVNIVMEYQLLIKIILQLGSMLMQSGAEIHRAEESMHRLFAAYHLQSAEVFVIPNCIIISAELFDGSTLTKMRRIEAHGTDITFLEQCNALCRTLCDETPPVKEAWKKLLYLNKKHRTYPIYLIILAYGISPAFFALLFGGQPADSLCAFFCGTLIGLILQHGNRFFSSNRFVPTFLCSAAASFFALLLVRVIRDTSSDIIIISALMMLVPGTAITNAMREIMAGDTISSISHIADAILCAVAIALGTAISLSVMRFFVFGS